MLSGEFQQRPGAEQAVDTKQPSGGKGVVARLRNQFETLAPAERQVAALVMEDPAKASRLSVTALAQRVGVSGTTVMRFARALGFPGYSDFRFELALEFQGELATAAEQITAEDEAGEVAAKVIAADRQALLETSQLLDAAELARAVDLLHTAGAIGVFGFGSSAAVALDACYRLSCLGLRSWLHADGFMQLAGSILLGEGDVALVISHSGRTVDALTVAKQAKAQGAKVICLTSFLQAPLVRQADAALVAATGESAYRRGTMASRIAQFSIVDSLYVALANRRAPHSQAHLERLNELLDQRRVGA